MKELLTCEICSKTEEEIEVNNFEDHILCQDCVYSVYCE